VFVVTDTSARETPSHVVASGEGDEASSSSVWGAPAAGGISAKTVSGGRLALPTVTWLFFPHAMTNIAEATATKRKRARDRKGLKRL
jgi:hypothetical protein